MLLLRFLPANAFSVSLRSDKACRACLTVEALPSEGKMEVSVDLNLNNDGQISHEAE